MIFFDQDTNFFTLDSALMERYRVEPEDSLEGLSSEPQAVLTDGGRYYVVPRTKVSNSPEFAPHTPFDLESIQEHFFSEQAIATAIGVDPNTVSERDRGSLTYGTTGATSMLQVLERVGAGPADRFLDIGCGCGLPVLLASHYVGQAVGVELVEPMVVFARKSAQLFRRENTDFLAMNVRDLEVAGFDLVYLAATTLTDELRQVIGEKLSELRPGAVAVSLTYPFSHPHLVLIDTFKSPFSWWNSDRVTEHQFFIHMRRGE